MTFYPDALVPIDAATDGLHREELRPLRGSWHVAVRRRAFSHAVSRS